MQVEPFDVIGRLTSFQRMPTRAPVAQNFGIFDFEKTRALFIARYFVAFAFLLSLPASPYGKGRCHGVTEGIRSSVFV